MAIIKVAKGGRTLKNALGYAVGKAEMSCGKDVSDNWELATQQMQDTKDFYNKTDGRIYKHYIQSFAPGETDVKTANEIGLKWAEDNFKGFEVFIGTHADKEHIHNHFIVNSVNFETGKKFNKNKYFLDELKESNDKFCLEYGLKITEKNRQIGEVRDYTQSKYQLLKRISEGANVKSYIVDTAAAVQVAADCSADRTEFIRNMKIAGYETNWQENRKHITFENSKGQKVRLSNLEKTFGDTIFTKEGLEDEFERVKRETELRRNSERTAYSDEWPEQSNNQTGVREHSVEGVSSGAVGELRDIEQELRQYSIKGREELRDIEEERQRTQREDERKRRELEKQQQQIERRNREHSWGMER